MLGKSFRQMCALFLVVPKLDTQGTLVFRELVQMFAKFKFQQLTCIKQN